MCTSTEHLDTVVRVGPKSDDQLVHTLASLTANLPHRRILTAGIRPEWATSEHIDVPYVYGKYAHAYAVLRAILAADLSESVVIADDDMYLMRPLETLPAYHRGRLGDIEVSPSRRAGLAVTIAAVGPDALCRDLHIPTVVHRAALAAQLDALPAGQAERIWWRTLHGGGCTERDDAKVRDQDEHEWDATWISTSDHSWNGAVGAHVRSVFQAKEQPCR